MAGRKADSRGNLRPSAFRASIEVNGDAQCAFLVRQIGKRARDTRPLMDELVGVLQMQQGRRVREAPYQPLTTGTVERKEREGENPGVFRDEMRYIKGKGATRERDSLYQALTSTGDIPGQLKYATRTMATFGVESSGRGKFFYARFVQNVKGTKRRILAISADDAMIITGWIERYVMGSTSVERMGMVGKGQGGRWK